MSEQAENQAGMAPDSGGKPGEGAEGFRRDCPGSGRAVVRIFGTWPACSECGRRDWHVEGEVMPSHPPAPGPDLIFWWLVDLKAKVEKLAALDVANAFHQLDGLRRDLGHVSARIDALGARAGQPERTTRAETWQAQEAAWRRGERPYHPLSNEPGARLERQLGPEACQEPVVRCLLSGLRLRPAPKERVLRDMVRELVRELRSTRSMAEQALRERGMAEHALRMWPVSGGFEGLDRFVRPAAEAPRENPGGMTAEDGRRAVEACKCSCGRLLLGSGQSCECGLPDVATSAVGHCPGCGWIFDLVPGSATPSHRHGTANCNGNARPLVSPMQWKLRNAP